MALQDYLNRYPNRTSIEEYALTNLYNTLIAEGNWEKIYDYWTPQLSNYNDSLVGAKTHSASTGANGAPTHSGLVGWSFALGQYLDTDMNPEQIRQWLVANHGNSAVQVVGYIDGVTGGGTNLDYWGCTRGAGDSDFYFRNRTGNDLQLLLARQSTSPRLLGFTYGSDLNTYVVREDVPGGAVDKKDITVLAGEAGELSVGATANTHTTQWVSDRTFHINGRNNGSNQNSYATRHKHIIIAHISANVGQILTAFDQFEQDLTSAPKNASIIEQGPSFSESITATYVENRNATIIESGPLFTESISVTYTPNLNASVIEQAPSFTASIGATLTAEIIATLDGYAPSFIESVSASLVKSFTAQMVENGPAFTSSVAVLLPIDTNGITTVRASNNTINVKRSVKTVRISPANRIKRVR
jgi:hypothetical protein